ncbi:MAG: biopolymer transporter ExbD [Myxococcales bacterium]|nr:biopolymer transporter ExbD [Myxococcales bacterium]MCB9754638.1 biopolymer transporter ExbD [Myxococcales bacterium]
MGMSVGNDSGGAKADINVTPLVDVCLVLLIIFMVLIPKTVPEISVQVPPETKQKHKKPPQNETLVIGLTKEGGLTLNRTPIDRTDLAKQITKQLEFRDKKVVFVNFDDDAKYGEAVAVLDLAKNAGAEVLGIMKDKEKKTPDTLRS